MVDKLHELGQLQVAYGGGVERHGRVRRIRADAQEPRADARLDQPEIVEHDAGGADSERRVGCAHRRGVGDSQDVAQSLLPTDGIELVLLDLGWCQQLCRRQPLELSAQTAGGELAEEQLAGGNVACGQTRFGAAGPGCDQVVGTRRVEVGVLDDRARGEDARDVARNDRALARGFQLVADHHLVARAQELACVQLPCVIRDAAHGRPSRFAQWARGQRDPHHRRGDDGVVEEDLIEIAEPEEEDSVGMLLFRLPVLPHDRGQSRGPVFHAAGNPNS